MKYIFAVFAVCVGFASIISTSSCTKNTVAQTDSLKMGLIAWYPLNNTGADSSGHGNDITYFVNMTAIADRLGRASSAFYFDGSTSYLMVPDNQQLRLNNSDITLSAWVKLDSYNASYGNNVLSKHFAGADNGWAWGITGQAYATPGVVTYGPGGGSANARGTKVMGTGQWHLITTTYNNTTKDLKIYVDGVLDTTTPNMPSPNATINANLYIGRDEPTTGTNGYFVKGSIDDVRIYTRVLSASSIQQLYAGKN